MFDHCGTNLNKLQKWNGGGKHTVDELAGGGGSYATRARWETAGPTYGTPALIPLIGGFGGGGVDGNETNGGGGGGGAILIASTTLIRRPCL
jgi:hypothetical protein